MITIFIFFINNHETHQSKSNAITRPLKILSFQTMSFYMWLIILTFIFCQIYFLHPTLT
jgi:hypothetical protein